jgi:phosphatidylglycerol:prolipoprotein diacylglycerol transferase
MVFPAGGDVPRHPSQLYEAALEGLLLFLILNIISRRVDILRRPGLLTGVFLLGYAIARFIVEFFRLPDANLGFIWGGWLTQGQLLTLPMALVGLLLMLRRPGGHVR